MPVRSPSLRIRSTTSYKPLSATGLTALDSTTKIALACWLRSFPTTASPELFAQANNTPSGDGVLLSLQPNTGFRLRTWSGTTATSHNAPLAAGRYFSTSAPYHVLVTASSVTGFCNWYLNGLPIGRSATTVVAWTAAGTRRTVVGSYQLTNTDHAISDLRVWAQNDADKVLLSPIAYARLAMQGRPLGETARYLWGVGVMSGLDTSGNARHLTTITAPSAAQVAVQGPPIMPIDRRLRTWRRAARAPVRFRPWFTGS